jgi:hypothetical protein
LATDPTNLRAFADVEPDCQQRMNRHASVNAIAPVSRMSFRRRNPRPECA